MWFIVKRDKEIWAVISPLQTQMAHKVGWGSVCKSTLFQKNKSPKLKTFYWLWWSSLYCIIKYRHKSSVDDAFCHEVAVCIQLNTFTCEEPKTQSRPWLESVCVSSILSYRVKTAEARRKKSRIWKSTTSSGALFSWSKPKTTYKVRWPVVVSCRYGKVRQVEQYLILLSVWKRL